MVKINIDCKGTPGTTYKYPTYGHFPKINISYHGTPVTTRKYLIYLIYEHFLKINISYRLLWVQKNMVIFPLITSAAKLEEFNLSI